MIEILVGLNVVDEEAYREYRRQITPLLDSVGGGFRYDFRISDALLSETDDKINRLFIIHFPDTASKDRFFGDPFYVEVKKQFFESAVAATTIISEYRRANN